MGLGVIRSGLNVRVKVKSRFGLETSQNEKGEGKMTREGVRKGGEETRTKEERKWDEGPSGQVKGSGETSLRQITKIKPTEPLTLVK